MKGFIGTALALLPKMQATKLARPIHFALSYDEEMGCAGAPLMLTDLQVRGVRPDGCIVGEPTSMRPIIAHKGINTYNCCVRGFAAHSSPTPKGLNAIEYAARLICFIRDVADEFRAQGPFDELYEAHHHRADEHDQGRQRGQHGAGRVQFPVRIPQPADDGPQARLQPHRRVRPRNAAAEDAKEHASAAIEFSRIASAPGLDRRNRQRSRSSCAR